MYFKVREGINEGEVEARFINTLLNISDPLTKAVSREVVNELAPVIAGIGDEPDVRELGCQSGCRVLGCLGLEPSRECPDRTVEYE
jgi:hypothetical protein